MTTTDQESEPEDQTLLVHRNLTRAELDFFTDLFCCTDEEGAESWAEIFDAWTALHTTRGAR
jgi:hypothetical protein